MATIRKISTLLAQIDTPSVPVGRVHVGVAAASSAAHVELLKDGLKELFAEHPEASYRWRLKVLFVVHKGDGPAENYDFWIPYSDSERLVGRDSLYLSRPAPGDNFTPHYRVEEWADDLSAHIDETILANLEERLVSGIVFDGISMMELHLRSDRPYFPVDVSDMVLE